MVLGLAWAGVIGSCITWGLVRVAIGQWQIKMILRESTPCDDFRSLRIAEECKRVLAISAPVQWLHHTSLGTPAVIGALKPAVVMPDESLQWSDMQLRCAIMHELAHIARGDVRSTLLAQISLALNFFHPLSHLLASRMRLDQELAADCLAAPHVGGQQRYLETLAALALRPVEPQFSRPILAFFPSRQTFVRRLEMLRTLRIATASKCHWQAICMLFLIVALALATMLVRPVLAQQPQKTAVPKAEVARTATADSKLPSLISYLPDSFASAVVIVDVAAIIQSPSVAPTIAQLPPEARIFQTPGLKVPLDDVQSLMAIVPNTIDPNHLLVLIRFKEGKALPQPAKAPDDTTRSIHSYGTTPPIEELDAQTLMIGEQSQQLAPVLRMTLSESGQGELKRLANRHLNASVTIALRTSSFRSLIERSRPELSALSPLWTDVTTGSVGLKLSDSLDADVILDSTKPKSVHDTLMAVRILMQNALSTFGTGAEAVSKTPPQQLLLMNLLRGVALKSLNDVKITETASTVNVSAKIDQAGPAILSLLLPAIQANRASALRMQATNSLKQIALALHNYHDTYKHFPPAIIEENGVQRSWRVELLPFMEQSALYNRYRKDEPWNSPNNLKVGQIVVPVYSPVVGNFAAPADPTLTPIRGIGGSHGVLGKKGVKISQITDGTSNTIFAVNVKEMVPWTQPDEYGPTPEELINAAGDHYFLAAFADGAVKVISTGVDPKVLAALMSMDGAETIELP